MRRWSEVGQRIATTTRTSEKRQLLGDYLATLDRAALGPAVVSFSGRAFPEADARALGLGWATLAEAVMRVGGVSRAELGAAYDRHSDLGRAVGDVLAARADDHGRTNAVTGTRTAGPAPAGPARPRNRTAARARRAPFRMASGFATTIHPA